MAKYLMYPSDNCPNLKRFIPFYLFMQPALTLKAGIVKLDGHPLEPIREGWANYVEVNEVQTIGIKSNQKSKENGNEQLSTATRRA